MLDYSYKIVLKGSIYHIQIGPLKTPLIKVWTPSGLADLIASMNMIYTASIISINDISFEMMLKRVQKKKSYHEYTNTPQYYERVIALYCATDYLLELVSFDWCASLSAPHIFRYRIEQGV